jgi:CheY-like chemotaxis protein
MPSTITGRPLSILVVDDDRDTADSFAVLLSAQGHRTRAVYCGKSAVAAAVADPFDVILLDLTMPDMGGPEVAREIQAAGREPVIIAVTGHGTDEAREAAWQAGFRLHLVKPVEPAALTHVLSEYSRRLTARKTAGSPGR